MNVYLVLRTKEFAVICRFLEKVTEFNKSNESNQNIEVLTNQDDEMDLELNFGETNDTTTSISSSARSNSKHASSNSKDESIREDLKKFVNRGLSYYFNCLKLWCDIAPLLVSRSKCDFLKFVDELVPCKSDDIQEIIKETESLDTNVVASVIELLHFVTRGNLCHWFGTEDEAQKLLNLLIVFLIY